MTPWRPRRGVGLLADLSRNKATLVGFVTANLATQLCLYFLGPSLTRASPATALIAVVPFGIVLGIVSTLYHLALSQEREARLAGELEAATLRGENERLERLLRGVSPPARTRRPRAGLATADRGCVVVASETVAYRLFATALREDRQGLAITRRHPEDVWEELDSPGLPVVWLSRATDPDAMNPAKLDLLFRVVERFRQLGGEVVLLDAVEYLTVYNDFLSVLRFVHALQDEVARGNLRLIIHLNPEALDARSFALLTRDGIALAPSEPERVTVSP